MMPMLTLHDGRKVKCGRRPPKQILHSGNYLIVVGQDGVHRVMPKLAAHFAATPNLPAAVDFSAKAMTILRRMLLNDALGCCVISDCGHELGLWVTNDGGAPPPITDQEILNAYRIWNPGTQDNGCVITEVMDRMTKQGLTLGGAVRKLGGYAAVDHTNPSLVKAAIAVFGTVKFGVTLPQAWIDARDGGLWDLAGPPVPNAGHDIPAVGYNAIGAVIATWGGLRTITWAALASRAYLDECYAPLSPDWSGADNIAPNGINAATLAADLALLAQGQIPDPGGNGPPPPPPPPGPAQPAFSLTFNRDVAAGQPVSFRTTKPVAKGKYDAFPRSAGAEVELDYGFEAAVFE